MALVLAMAGFTYAQKSALNKITPELQAELDKRPNADELFRIIIVMADEYDQNQMSRQIQFLGKTERRAYVIEELQRFSKASQYDLMQLLTEGAKANTVTDVNPFWIFNGISCITNREMIATLSQRKDIDCIESDELRNMLPANEKPSKAVAPTRELAWHVTQVHANEVWPLGYDGTGVVVAIIDTGVNYNHADLADHMWDGGLQYPNHGYDYANNDNNPMDDNGHGSHCAGITAGDGTSGIQTGIAPNATIMALKVLGANGSGTSTARTNAQQFAMQHGADVVSMSLGSSGASGSKTDRQAFVNMMNAGIVASIAAGNDGEYYSSSHHTTNDYGQSVYYAVPKNVGSPGNCPPPWHNPDQTLSGGQSAVITIGASNRNDRKSTFSSFGPVTWSGVSGYNDYRYQANSSTNIGLIKPDIIVPGTDITSLLYSSNSDYFEECGTSMATPLASGIMALMLQANPTLTPAQIDEILETTALPVDYRITKNNYTGAGRGDALAAIDAILTQATKPTNLNFETCGGNVNLSWTASTAPAGYCIYRDNVQVGTTTETSYTDENAGTGKHVYYVRANDNSGHQSVHSNSVLCTVEPYATVPEDLTIGWDGTHANLDWNASTISNTLSSTNLYFSDEPYTAYGGAARSTVYWGMCFNPEELRPYKGMSIDQVSIPVYATGIAYTLRIYRGTTYGNTTGTPVYTQSFTPTSGNWNYQAMTLTNPYALDDITQDLWITFSATLGNSEGYPAVVGEYDGPSSNCFYMGDGTSVNDLCWSHVPDFGSDYNYAVCIKVHLTRTMNYTPTYNVYLDNNSKANNLSVTNYTDTPSLHSGDNNYFVTSVVNGNESCPSNEAKIVEIDNSQTDNDDIAIDNSLVYIITPTGTLTANGNLSSTDPARLILQDGAQLINSSTGVNATVKKDITAFTTGENDGWNLIASPFTEDIMPNSENGLTLGDFDLYRFNQSAQPDNQGNALEWENWEKQQSDHYQFSLKNGDGYLYSNSNNQSLVFQGTLTANATPTALDYDVNATLKGFNLIGNPYPCNAYTTQPFYVLQYNSNEDRTKFVLGSGAIPPCAAIMVQAQGTDETVAFSKTALRNQPNVTVSVAKADMRGNAIIDKARIGFDPSYRLAKFDFSEGSSQLYIPQNGKEFAVAYANEETEIPLNFKAAQNDTYTLSIETEDLELNYLHLIDNLTGNDVDLLATPTYTFDAKTSDYTTRFRLFFAPTCEDFNDDNATFAFISGGNIIINNEGEAQLQIIDVMGRILYTEAIQGSVGMPFNLGTGTYILRLMSTDKVHTQKVVVQ